MSEKNSAKDIIELHKVITDDVVTLPVIWILFIYYW